MIRKLFVSGIAVLLLSSCAAEKTASRTVMLKNPQTLDFQSCQVEDWGSEEAYAAKQRCVEQWQQQGYVIWGEH
ncbi:MAG: hypothetical protein ACK5PS_04060 [Desulfopila sp.]